MTALPPFGTPAGEAVRALAIAVVLGLLLATADRWHRTRRPPVEWTRKLVHLGGGLAAAALPWLFSSHWTVLFLSTLMAVLLVAGRSRGWIPAVTSVERDSHGELWFPAVVYLLFVTARHQPVFYLIALSSLAVSDTMAALLGRIYGRLTFTVGGSRKSLEGSGVFFLVTFLAVHLSLLLATPLARPVCVMVALQIALLIASAEAIAARGTDNLVVPLGTYYLLLKLTPQPAVAVAIQLAVQLGLLVLMVLLAWRTRLVTFGGAIATHLVLYGAFSLGGPSWMVVPAGALIAFQLLDRRYGGTPGVPRHGHEVVEIYWVAIVAMLVLFADNSLATVMPLHPALASGHPFYPPFVGAFAASLALAAFELRERTSATRRHSPMARRAQALAIGAVAVILPGLAVLGSLATVETIVACALPLVLGAPAYFALRGRVRLGGPLHGPLRVQALCVLIAVAVTLPVHFAWIGIDLRGLGR